MALQIIELKIGSEFKWIHVFWHCIDYSTNEPKLKLIIDFNHKKISQSLVLIFNRLSEEKKELLLKEKYTPNNY